MQLQKNNSLSQIKGLFCCIFTFEEQELYCAFTAFVKVWKVELAFIQRTTHIERYVQEQTLPHGMYQRTNEYSSPKV